MPDVIDIRAIRDQKAIFDAALQRLGGDPTAITQEEFVSEVLRQDVPEHLLRHWLLLGIERHLEVV